MSKKSTSECFENTQVNIRLTKFQRIRNRNIELEGKGAKIGKKPNEKSLLSEKGKKTTVSKQKQSVIHK